MALTKMVLWFGVVIIVMVTITKFMFICVWKSMRTMNDDLMVRIAINLAVLSSIIMGLLKFRAQVNSGYNVEFKSTYELFVCTLKSLINKNACLRVILGSNPPCSFIKDFRVHR